MTDLEPLASLASKPPQDPSSTSTQRDQPAQPSPASFSATGLAGSAQEQPKHTAASDPSRPVPRRSSSTNNYAQALADAISKTDTSGQKHSSVAAGQNATGGDSGSGGMKVDTSSAVAGDHTKSPSSASWRPKFDRQQSWSDQDRRRAMQEGLMSPVTAKEMGFSSAQKGKAE